MISSDRLDPGTTGRVEATIDTSGRKGLLVKRISIFTNDPTSPVRNLTISLDVVPGPAPTK